MRRARRRRAPKTLVGRVNQTTGVSRMASMTRATRQRQRGNARRVLNPVNRLFQQAQANRYERVGRFNSLEDVAKRYRQGAQAIRSRDSGQIVGYMARYSW